MIKFNAENEIIVNEKGRAILVGVSTGEDIEYYMEELAALAEAANLEVVGELTQNLERIQGATVIGTGKLEELRDMVEKLEATIVVFNDQLTGMQLRNIEEIAGVQVIDRTILILDIFAQRAQSRQGKLQVELSQLQYRLPRLMGFGKALSRQGAGIGTRGPGEKKLETDRRHIERRIKEIKGELIEAEKTDQIKKLKRQKSQIKQVALVGYTNAGKSTLMNAILKRTEGEKQVEAKDMLFATLDSHYRRITLDKARQLLLVDTVGFVSKLPHQLVDAFKTTLKAASEADLIIHLVDCSTEMARFQMDITSKVLEEIGASAVPQLLVFNKADKIEGACSDLMGIKSLEISAKTGMGVDRLMEEIEKQIFGSWKEVTLMIPFDKGQLNQYVCQNCQVLDMSYVDTGTKFDVRLKEEDYGRLKEYIV